ncbi:SDR family NAD(P)-dependent oxidoreductase [Spirillospora sp. CA-255316]
MTDLLRGRHIFVSGRGSGVNLVIVRACAAAGADISICGGTEQRLEGAATELASLGARVAYADIDLLGAFHCASAAFAQLRETRGALLFVSGGQAISPCQHQAHVSAAKAGVDALMKSLAVEWGPNGIRANSIWPGPVSGSEGMPRLTKALSGPHPFNQAALAAAEQTGY